MRQLALIAVCSGALFAAEEEVVFRSDVSLVRVDVQVLDRDSRAVSGLQPEDFELFESGRKREIRNFLAEKMPVDVLFLLDVSGSMRTHVERLTGAAHKALTTLGGDDRVAVMVFDRQARVVMPFRARDGASREMENSLRRENFRGGTDIPRAIIEAARHMERSARKEARRAIVILTDDQTEFEANDWQVSQALSRASAVLSALIAPNAIAGGRRGGYPGGGGGRRGGIGLPGGGWPGGQGGVILGPGGGWPGGGGGQQPQGGRGAGGPHPAGTPETARESGGDSMSVDDPTSLETTLSRLRQRYALHFLVPDDARSGQRRNIEIRLSARASKHYDGAEVRYRRTYVAPSGSGAATPTEPTGISGAAAAPPERVEAAISTAPSLASEPSSAPVRRRRVAQQESSGPRGPNPAVAAGPSQ